MGWRCPWVISTKLGAPRHILKSTFKAFPPQQQRVKFPAYCNDWHFKIKLLYHSLKSIRWNWNIMVTWYLPLFVFKRYTDNPFSTRLEFYISSLLVCISILFLSTEFYFHVFYFCGKVFHWSLCHTSLQQICAYKFKFIFPGVRKSLNVVFKILDWDNNYST